jgi:phosphate/sulfate permease
MNRRRAHGVAAPITALVVCALALALGAAPALASKPSAKQVANKVLKLDPRKPADIDLFTSIYANAGHATK